MRRLPPSTRAPKLDTILSLSDYHVKGAGTSIAGTATLNQSLVEGAMVGPGTTVEFDFGAKPLTYAARGTIVGLDVRRLGQALQIAALDDPRYAGRVSGDFDVKAAGTSLAELDLTASGTLQDSTMWGTHVPAMAFKTEIVNSSLTVYAKGPFNQLDPAVILERKNLAGNVSGVVDATLRIADLSQPVTMSSIAVDGRLTLAPSLFGSIQIVAADIEAKYAGEVADITKLHVDGPDVALDASGRLAIGREATSDLKYHINATDITELGRIVGQSDIDGMLVLDGTITGSSGALETKGTLNGNGLVYGRHKVLDLDSDYSATVTDLDFVNARVEAKSKATFVELAGVQINEVVATTKYADKRLEFDTNVQQKTRELGATGSVIFHPDHQEIHLPTLALKTEGVEWRNVAGSEAAIQYRQNEISIKDFRLASADQTLDVAGTLALAGGATTGALEVKAVNVDLAQAEALLLLNRGLSGRLNADAKISGRLATPNVDGRVEVTNGGFQNYKYQSLVADVDYGDNRIMLDATLQQAPGVAITARGTVPTSAFQPGAGTHIAGTPEDALDVRIQTTALNLGVVQGFTTVMTDVGGTLEADVRLTGSGRDPHVVGFVEIRDGAFAVPRFGTSYSGLDTRIDLEPEMVRVRRFEILDENGEQLAVAGQLAVHEREVGAVDFTLESENFEIIDNELGDVGVGTNLKITGELGRPKLEGDIRVTAGRLEVDRILQLFYDPYRVEALPDVASPQRVAETAGSAEQATRLALARAEKGATPVEAKPVAARRETRPRPLRHSRPCSRTSRSTSTCGFPTTSSCEDGGSGQEGAREPHSVTSTSPSAVTSMSARTPGGPVTLAGTVNMVRGTYQFQGRQFDLARDGTLRFTGDVGLQSGHRRHRDAQDPRYRCRGESSHHRHARLARADALEHAAARRVRRAGPHRLQSPDQRAGDRRTRLARRDRRRHRDRLPRRTARRIDWPGARPRPLRDHHVVGRRQPRRRRHDRRTDWRSHVPQDAPAVRRAHLQRVPAGVSDQGLPAPGGIGGAGNLRRRQPDRSAPHRARGTGSDFLLQLLKAVQGSRFRVQGSSKTFERVIDALP